MMPDDEPEKLLKICPIGFYRVSNFEISDIMINHPEPEDCVKKLIDAALDHGGRDNITVIVCRLM